MTQYGSLNVTTLPAVDGLTVHLKGQADLRDATELIGAFLEHHREALKAKARRVSVDLRDVEFMNSTALGAFVRWVAELRKVPAAQQYRLLIQGSEARRWQRSSLHALAAMAPENIDLSIS